MRRVEECGKQPAVRVHCAGCGEVHECPQLCSVRSLCGRCAGRASYRYQKRLTKALGSALSGARAFWRDQGSPRLQGPRLVMLTLTCATTGDLAADRATIQLGHVRLRSWLHRRVGAPPYVRAWETTCGSEGRGHVHAHVATVLPYLDYVALRAEWMRATEGKSSGIHVSQSKRSPAALARYLSKYVSKGSHTCTCAREQKRHELPAEVAAQWLDTCSGARSITASRGLLDPYRAETMCCEAPFVVDDVFSPAHQRWRNVKSGPAPPPIWDGKRWVSPKLACN